MGTGHDCRPGRGRVGVSPEEPERRHVRRRSERGGRQPEDRGNAMAEVLDQGEGKLIGLKVSGKLLHEDYQEFVPLLEKLIEAYGSIRCLIEMTDFHGIEPRALWDEIQFDVRHARQIERLRRRRRPDLGSLDDQPRPADLLQRGDPVLRRLGEGQGLGVDQRGTVRATGCWKRLDFDQEMATACGSDHDIPATPPSPRVLFASRISLRSMLKRVSWTLCFPGPVEPSSRRRCRTGHGRFKEDYRRASRSCGELQRRTRSG